jgi:hypothetical protein
MRQYLLSHFLMPSFDGMERTVDIALIGKSPKGTLKPAITGTISMSSKWVAYAADRRPLALGMGLHDLSA